MRRVCSWLLVAVLSVSCAGGGPVGSQAVSALLDPAGEGEAFFELPWPNDIRRAPDGTVDLEGLPVRDLPILWEYVKAFRGNVEGFSTQGAIYFRFSGPVDVTSLPSAPEETQTAESPVFLLDVDPESPERGRRIPVLVTFRPQLRYVGRWVLVLLPVPGFPLRPATTYAAGVTRSLKALGGEPVERAPGLDCVLAPEPPAMPGPWATLWEAYGPLRDACRQGIVDCGELVSATVFTTQDPVSFMGKLREAVHEDLTEPPEPQELTLVGDMGSYYLYEGRYEGPNYQAGEPPYSTDGDIRTDSSGRPILQRTERLRFALSVPKGRMPPSGWPVVLYAHGTGGDYETFVRAGVAENLADVRWHGRRVRFAVFGIDQVLHGPRCSDRRCNTELDFFNVNNPLAARDNVRQAAVDDFQLVRLVRNFHAVAPETGQRLEFDADNIFFMGHSQGGITGPPFLAFEPGIRAAVLSGAAGNMILALNLKTSPVDIPGLVELLFGLEEMDVFQFPLTMVQMLIEPADPMNYARLLVVQPPDGRNPLSVFQSWGLEDTYSPGEQIEAFGVAMGLTWTEPYEADLPFFALAGQEAPVARPVAGNLAQGAATGVFVQYVPPVGVDGHFVVFHVEQAMRDYAGFLASAVLGAATLE